MKYLILSVLCFVLCACDSDSNQDNKFTHKYKITAPDGRTITITSDREPTESDIQQIFNIHTPESVQNSAKPRERNWDTQPVPTQEQRKRNFESRLLNICQNRFAQEHIAYPTTYKNNVCICFAEKTTAFVSASEQEITKYNSSELYQLKTQEKFFGECATKNQKYKFF